DTLVRGLEGLSTWDEEVRAHICWQLWQLLAAAGFEPMLDRCVRCGGAIGEALGFSFDGGVVCRRCTADRALGPSSVAALQALAASREACPRSEIPGAVLELLARYASRHVDSEFRSLCVIDQMFGTMQR
ncbi:MAG TPA: hypothetical protein ENN80_12550, partial [Candidatus Hydrogenedentes bacterium]|nr:hypothetical protein [Candidatus Hydrogenedentota bacterium]